MAPQERPQQLPCLGLHRIVGDTIGIAHEGVADAVEHVYLVLHPGADQRRLEGPDFGERDGGVLGTEDTEDRTPSLASAAGSSLTLP